MSRKVLTIEGQIETNTSRNEELKGGDDATEKINNEPNTAEVLI